MLFTPLLIKIVLFFFKKQKHLPRKDFRRKASAFAPLLRRSLEHQAKEHACMHASFKIKDFNKDDHPLGDHGNPKGNHGNFSEFLSILKKKE